TIPAGFRSGSGLVALLRRRAFRRAPRMSGDPGPAEAVPLPAEERGSLTPKRPAALVFASLAIGQILAFISLSLVSAYLGLDRFGRFGLCMVDFAVAANIANFALPAASIPFAIRGGM